MALRERMTEALIEKSARSLANAELIAAFNGQVTRCKSGPRYTERKRGGFVADRSTIAPGIAQRAGLHYHHDNVSKLIAAR